MILEIENAYILAQHRKGVKLEDLMSRARPAPPTPAGKDPGLLMIHGYRISASAVRSIYEVPAQYERHFRMQNKVPQHVVIDEDWINDRRFVMV